MNAGVWQCTSFLLYKFTLKEKKKQFPKLEQMAS